MAPAASATDCRAAAAGEMQMLMPKDGAKSDKDDRYKDFVTQRAGRGLVFLTCVGWVFVALAARVRFRPRVTMRNHPPKEEFVPLTREDVSIGDSLGNILQGFGPIDVTNAKGGSTETTVANEGSSMYPPRVPSDVPGVPAYQGTIGSGVPVQVSYDARSIRIDGKAALLLGGSMHPVRTTPSGWNRALDEAVAHGLNLVTIYIMWSAHQPLQSFEMNWHLPYAGGQRDPDSWTLAMAIKAAAQRGLFVHLRIGPYVCAEYNYGGIPEWVPLHSPDMSMRRPNQPWLNTMESYVTNAINYITSNELWAYQGGNIILGQIENEIGGSTDPDTEHLLVVDESGNFFDPDFVKQAFNFQVERPEKFRNATLQDYANWCGNLVQKLAPNVTWTMCSGLSAPNTISTCNGECSTWWLEEYGASGRIQKDHPPMLTEFEGGFQIWGEKPSAPTDYFWGRTARTMTYQALQWFARGGTHLNYYMWCGFYNRGRAAAAGITNMYATEAPMCPSGERRQPKWGHYHALHRAIISVAPTLLEAETAVNSYNVVERLEKDGTWSAGPDQRLYVYHVNKESYKDVMILENNDATEAVTVRLPATIHIFYMAPQSAMLLVDGIVIFDSSKVDATNQYFMRTFSPQSQIPRFLNWFSWSEPIGASSDHPLTNTSALPVEQTLLNMGSGISSDYAWFETTLSLDDFVRDAWISIDSQAGSAFTVYVDDNFVGDGNNHFHSSKAATFNISIGHLEPGDHKISFLSESLGYNNLIGRWGADTKAKTKGITGNVTIVGYGGDGSSIAVDLTDGNSTWRSFPGLHHEYIANKKADVGSSNAWNRLVTLSGGSSLPSWTSTLFYTPALSIFNLETERLYLQLTSGRGHLWLNGYDLGRYWDITRSDGGDGGSDQYSQQYYMLPSDLLSPSGSLNKLVMFDTFGSDRRRTTKLVKSSIVASDQPNFVDGVDFGDECLA